MARKAQWPYSLGTLDLFADCSAAELERLGSLMTMLSAEAGTVLIGEGEIGAEFVILGEGTAEVTIRQGGQTVVLAELAAGDFVGEMSLLRGTRRSATVTATSSLTFYVCNAAEFASLLDAAPSVAGKITAAAEARGAANVLAA
jgi:CRP-like cAMP-binding protein